MKKIKRKKIKKYRLFLYMVLFVLIVIAINSAYSYIINSLRIDGTISIKKPETVNVCDGKLDYNVNSWVSNNNMYYVYSFKLTNSGNKAYNTWTVYFEIPEDAKILSSSSVELEIIGTKVKASSLHYNGNLQPGNSINFEVQLVTKNMNYEPTNISVNNCYGSNDSVNVTDNLNIEFKFVSMNGVNTYQYNIIITNVGSETITNWQFAIEKPNNAELVNVWDANYIVKNSSIEFSSMTHNGTLSPGSSTSFGIMIKTDQQQYSPLIYE